LVIPHYLVKMAKVCLYLKLYFPRQIMTSLVLFRDSLISYGNAIDPFL